MALKLAVQAVGSFLSLICEYELYILPNKKLVPERIMVKAICRTDHPDLARHLLRDRPFMQRRD